MADHPGSVLPPPVADDQLALKNGELTVLNVMFIPAGSTVIGDAVELPAKLMASTSEPLVRIPKWPLGPPKLGPVIHEILAADAEEILQNVITDMASKRGAAIGNFSAVFEKLIIVGLL
ncbi:MAG: hypothetical protein Q7U93_09840 [Nitrosomonas sp.]|nr:hypothetical protein [Nitrosomonas sp.]